MVCWSALLHSSSSSTQWYGRDHWWLTQKSPVLCKPLGLTAELSPSSAGGSWLEPQPCVTKKETAVKAVGASAALWWRVESGPDNVW